MKVYNTMTMSKEDFKTIEEGKVRMYVCGPTVYNFAHIGNARAYIVFDAIRRYLEHKGYEVIHAQNFTDVDDKIIQRANEEGVSAKDVSEKYTEEFLNDAKKSGIKRPHFEPKVTEEMPEIIKMIQTLIDKGFAYEAGGTVFFETQKSKHYGKLSKKKTDDLSAGIRVKVDELKRSPYDFVLWKPCKPGEPYWESPWGNGRPGWHIECSAMSKKYLGDSIDIHGGGIDLIFPHHENEIAQSEAANGTNFCTYWLHNGHINVENQKMSKSKGNFYTWREITEKYKAEVVRFFMLSVHYRSQINFSDDLLHSAESGLNRIKNALKNLDHIAGVSKNENMSEDEKQKLSQAAIYENKFTESMDDDFNTADAISNIFELTKFANTNADENCSKQFAQSLKQKITSLMDVLGLIFSEQSTVDTAYIEEMIQQRQQARSEKNWAMADKIRNELTDMGIILEDTVSGVKYSFK